MAGRNQYRKSGTITTQAVCALSFFVFSFCWLYFFQSDVLAVGQHVLSGGKTHYNQLVGALLITLVLFLLQQVVHAFARLSRRSHALTYFPSMLVLTVLSCISPDIDRHFSFGPWVWVTPLLIAVWLALVWLGRQIYPFANDLKESTGIFSRRMWMNVMLMVAMMIGVALFGNTNAVFHYTAHAEASLARDDTDEALRVGARSLETDENLTMLRIFALSKKGQLADRLFEYAIRGTSADMLPLQGSKSRLRLMPDSILWSHFGRQPLPGMTVSTYLDSLATDTLATPAHRDYRLMGQLIDRKLDAFVGTLPHYYPLTADSLPLHYREALQLYQHQHDTILCRDSLMHLRFRKFLRYDSIYPNPRERKIRTEEEFSDTYWYYYY
ncbi:MAG: DUF6057 family protein [Prevotella sp.]|nr:DUF6057 family protein [Prevotella sp.]